MKLDIIRLTTNDLLLFSQNNFQQSGKLYPRTAFMIRLNSN